MRIGMVAPPWLAVPPRGYGGTEAVVDRLARALERLGHEVVLVAHRSSTCPVERHWVLDDVTSVPIGTSVHEARHVIAAYRALAGAVDVIHDHTTLGALLGPARTAGSAPVVVTNHGPFDALTGPLFVEATCAPRTRAPASGASVVAISHDHAARGRAAGVPIAAVVHHGLDVDGMPVGSGDGGHAVFVGRMHPAKGVHRAIEAARTAGVPLKIAAKMAEAAEHAYFEREVRPRLGSDVEFLGELAPAERDAVVGSACALLNPISWPEPFGMVMLEALAVGTPVLAFPAGAAPEIVEDGVSGFLCHDEAEMAARLRAVVDAGHDPGLRRAARERARSAFSVDAMALGYLGVYTAAREQPAGPLAARA